MDNQSLVDGLRSLEWRKYKQSVACAIDDRIELEEDDLLYAIAEIPEHHKINALIDYSMNVRPISKVSYDSIITAIKSAKDVESYKDYLFQEMKRMVIQ